MTEKKDNFAAFWERESKAGNAYYSSQKMTFGDLRNFIKTFKDQEKVEDTDFLNFLLFPKKPESDKYPSFTMIIRKWITKE